MRLFAPDLYRNFAIGFAVGAALIAGANVENWGDELASPARAAETPHAPGPSPEAFLGAESTQAK
ncbi:hypothetical protein SOQ14_06570 [Erythrobacter sp. T5W1-R]|uniref:hypothetical protein n=1 Tax=Erythrobacter sp. T5W1-R TaxID=3101752 RepID=UPI002AFDD3F4|nr:hypothetical protein [Erythrobacter sp. T5W1-R]MEA1618576.1 hypothetical protein [Erythrobacter sp. T5W1-R]